MLQCRKQTSVPSGPMAFGVLLQTASSAQMPSVALPSRLNPSSSFSEVEQVLIGVARDAAFNFYYHEYVSPRCKMPCLLTGLHSA